MKDLGKQGVENKVGFILLFAFVTLLAGSFEEYDCFFFFSGLMRSM